MLYPQYTCTCISTIPQSKLQEAAELIGAEVVMEFVSKGTVAMYWHQHDCQHYYQVFPVIILTHAVTHVVTYCDDSGCCLRTMKCLSAIASGKWLLNYNCEYNNY